MIGEIIGLGDEEAFRTGDRLHRHASRAVLDPQSLRLGVLPRGPVEVQGRRIGLDRRLLRPQVQHGFRNDQVQGIEPRGQAIPHVGDFLGIQAAPAEVQMILPVGVVAVADDGMAAVAIRRTQADHRGQPVDDILLQHEEGLGREPPKHIRPRESEFADHGLLGIVRRGPGPVAGVVHVHRHAAREAERSLLHVVQIGPLLVPGPDRRHVAVEVVKGWEVIEGAVGIHLHAAVHRVGVARAERNVALAVKIQDLRHRGRGTAHVGPGAVHGVQRAELVVRRLLVPGRRHQAPRRGAPFRWPLLNTLKSQVGSWLRSYPVPTLGIRGPLPCGLGALELGMLGQGPGPQAQVFAHHAVQGIGFVPLGRERTAEGIRDHRRQVRIGRQGNKPARLQVHYVGQDRPIVTSNLSRRSTGGGRTENGQLGTRAAGGLGLQEALRHLPHPRWVY